MMNNENEHLIFREHLAKRTHPNEQHKIKLHILFHFAADRLRAFF